jgi:hypothetical protein
MIAAQNLTNSHIALAVKTELPQCYRSTQLTFCICPKAIGVR